jgi:hypothetical protein
MLLVLGGCAPRQAAVPQSEAANDTSVGVGPAVALERTACFGRCPVYQISVSPDGVVSYEGKAHVRHLGPATGQISVEQVSFLVSELEKGGYFSFAPRYTPGDSACGRYATDSPAVITSVQSGGRAKRIEHDYGCSSAPGALVVLERRIDEVLGSSRWTGR